MLIKQKFKSTNTTIHIAHPSGKEGETSNKAYREHEALLDEYISAGHQTENNKKTAKYRKYRKETKVRKTRTKKLMGKPKEKAERYRSQQQKWKKNRKDATKQVLDGAFDAKCEIDPKVIEEI